jgi:hypothetical protein
MRTLSLLLLLLCPIGCASYETRTYDVTVKNDSSGPITIWLTKSGPPFEDGWLAPEDIAIQSPRQPVKVIGGVVVPQGKQADTGLRTGKFEPQAQAVLRVYTGQRTFDQLLASSEEDKSRVDMRLHPGRSELTVTGVPGAIQVKEHE